MAWRTAARPVDAAPQITVYELKERLDRGEINVLGVRHPSSSEQGQRSHA